MLGVDHATGEIETFYVGKTDSSNSRHFVRIYDKLLEILKKRKVALFANYLDYKYVTRFEIEIKSQSCRRFGVNAFHALDQSALWGIVQKVLVNRSSKWSILPFLKKN